MTTNFLRRQLWLLLLVVWPALLAHAAVADNTQEDNVGERIADFILRDFRGEPYSLGMLESKKLIVVAFLGTECPLAQIYGPRLESLAQDFGPRGVEFVGIDSNVQDSLAEMAAFARARDLTFPLLKDPGGTIADRFQAQRTPEVFVLDSQRFVKYRGRIDDQYAPGSARAQPQHEDLRQALEELLADTPVTAPRTPVAGCLIGRVRDANESSAVTWFGQIEQLMERRCVECHRPGQIGPFSLTTYDDASSWAETIGEVVADERMPPWHADPAVGKFVGDRRLSTPEKNLVHQWVAAGAPRGVPPVPAVDAKAPRRANDSASLNVSGTEAGAKIAARLNIEGGWSLPRAPDAVFAMRPTPFPVPAQGPVDYQYFEVATTFKEDRWISAAEVLPGNRTVVHHAVVHSFNKTFVKVIEDGTTQGYLAAFVPGLRPDSYPPGMAKRLPAGTRLVFEMHYTPNGVPQTDVSKLGLIFMDPKDVKYEVFTGSVVRNPLTIPAGAADFRLSATSPKAPSDCIMLALMPHMHLRGASCSFELLMADGTSKTLLNVPHYDSMWQTCYRLTEPLKLPTNSRLKMVAHFDNSADNPRNPDPKQIVHWGRQNSDEMMVGYFEIALPIGQAPPRPTPKKVAAKAAIKTPSATSPRGTAR